MLLYRPIGYVIYVTSLDIWCQAVMSIKRQKSTNLLLMCTVHWHFQRLVHPLFCRQFYLLEMLGFANFTWFPCVRTAILQQFCRDKTASLSLRILLVTVPRFLTSFTAMNKHRRYEQSGDSSKDFMRYTSQLILWLFDNNSRTLHYHTYSYSIWYRS